MENCDWKQRDEKKLKEDGDKDKRSSMHVQEGKLKDQNALK